jgi:hypothetical protein
LSARLLKSFYKRRMEPMSATMITTPLFAEPLRGDWERGDDGWYIVDAAMRRVGALSFETKREAVAAIRAMNPQPRARPFID